MGQVVMLLKESTVKPPKNSLGLPDRPRSCGLDVEIDAGAQTAFGVCRETGENGCQRIGRHAIQLVFKLAIAFEREESAADSQMRSPPFLIRCQAQRPALRMLHLA